MLRKLIVYLIVTLTLLSTVNFITVYAENREVYRASIYLLAISGEGRGYVVKAGLKVKYPGSGSVTVRPHELIDDSVKLSIEYSLLLTHLLTGFNYTAYDYEFVFETNRRLEGLSGTLPIVLTLLSFVKKINVHQPVGATGLVTPHGTVGLVGGLEEKYRAGYQYGLVKIIGPKFTAEPRSRFIPVIDVFTAFRKYSNVSLYGVNYTDEIELPDWLKKRFNNVFINSYHEFHSLLNRTLKGLKEIGVDYENLSGYKLVNKSFEHYRLGNYYTASTYAFRAYVNLTITYLSIFRNESFLNEILWNTNKTLMHLNNVFKSMMNSVVKSFWDIDALINAYDRYLIALEAFRRYRSNSSDTYMLVLAHARAITSETWLNLLLNDTTGIINEKFITNALVKMGLFCNYTISYVSYVYPDAPMDELHRVCGKVKPGGGFEGVINYWSMLVFTHRVIDLSISEEIYSKYIGLNDINELMESIRDVFRYIARRSGERVPSYYAITEVSLNYVRDGETLSVIAELLLDLMVNLSIYLSMINSNFIQEESVEHVEQQIIFKIPIELRLTIGLIMVATGSLIIVTSSKVKRSRAVFS